MTWRFEFYGSLQFWVALMVVAVLVRAGGASARVKGVLLLASSTALLLAIPRFGLLDLVLVWAITGSSFLAARALTGPSSDAARRRSIAIAGGGLVLAALAFFKYRYVQDLFSFGSGVGPAASDYLFLLGISYFSFKALHVVIETHRRSITTVAALDYFNYITFFPSFISGPISRYPQFVEQLGPVPPGTLESDLSRGGQRIVHGLFKKLVLAKLVFPFTLMAIGGSLDAVGRRGIALGLYASALYFYFDFAAYSDLAIGAARLLGMTLPENFDNPFLRRNIRELWTHWHMSLTSWLVDYVYWPVVRRLRQVALFRPRPVLLSTAAMTVTFIACGLWHGEALNFILWGACHGVAISLVTVYQRRKRTVRSPALQRYFQSRTGAVIGAVGTFHFFAAALVLFLFDLSQLRILARALLR